MAIKCLRKTEAKVRPVVTNFFTRTPYSRSLDVWRDSLCSYFRYHLSHFFLSPAIIQWINKWVYHGTCQHRCFSDRANIIKVWSSNDKTETKWKKVNNNSTIPCYCPRGLKPFRACKNTFSSIWKFYQKNICQSLEFYWGWTVNLPSAFRYQKMLI